MATTWILTIGNSDIKLTSDYKWGYLRENKRAELSPCYGDFKEPIEESDGSFSLPARVMGIIYGDVLETHWDYFNFPLISTFIEEIKTNRKNQPDRIIILLTDQEKIFEDNNSDSMYNRCDPDCPYWKDTITLEPILRHYFQQKFSKVVIDFAVLEPSTITKGLDHWDETLTLIQQRFSGWGISEGDQVIVSHQAGTPAISSAVQLTALMLFGKKVKFLVSNEFLKNKAHLLPGSAYLSTLQIKEAQQLLSQFDYGGVKRTLKNVKFEDLAKQAKLDYALALLELVELWNAAKFDEFAKKLRDSQEFAQFNQKLHNSDKLRSDTWWWKGYEMAYLAQIRIRQKNSSESLFHSVRAIEGLICEWAIQEHSSHIHYKFIKSDHNGNKQYQYRDQRFYEKQEGSPCARKSIDQKFKDALQYDNQRKSLEDNKLGLYGQVLYTLFKSTFKSKKDLNSHPIKIVWEELADIRNNLFHQLRGITEQEVYEAWGCKKREQWEQRVFDCVQLVSHPQGEVFKSLKQSSLITPIHEKLEDEISALL